MKKALFTDAEAMAAADEFTQYMAPRTVVAGGKNGDVTLYGENPNTRKPPAVNIHDEKRKSMGYYKNLIAEVLELNDAGLSVTAIADRLGLAAITVANVLEQYGRPEGA